MTKISRISLIQKFPLFLIARHYWFNDVNDEGVERWVVAEFSEERYVQQETFKLRRRRVGPVPPHSFHDRLTFNCFCTAIFVI